MTLREKYDALLADLHAEKVQFGERWASYYDSKIADLTSAIEERFEPEPVECSSCGGAGGYDASRDCEVYDDWQACPSCDGTGEEPNE